MDMRQTIAQQLGALMLANLELAAQLQEAKAKLAELQAGPDSYSGIKGGPESPNDAP